MTPKEKAEELVDRFTIHQIKRYGAAEYEFMKGHALIAVEQVLETQRKTTRILSDTVVYWQEVKKEIEKL